MSDDADSKPKTRQAPALKGAYPVKQDAKSASFNCAFFHKGIRKFEFLAEF